MHRGLSLVTTVITASLVVLSAPRKATADALGFGATDGQSVQATAVDTGIQTRPARRSQPSTRRCNYQRLDPASAALVTNILPFVGGSSTYASPAPAGAGAWNLKICSDEPRQSWSADLYWAPKRVDAARAAQQAVDRSPLPLPLVVMSPAADRPQVVGLPTWLWVNPTQWQPITAKASAGAITVTVTAVPDRVEWDLGNGDTLTCAGPGTPYDPARPAGSQSSDCTYVYPRSSAGAPGEKFTASATVIWSVTWSAPGIAGGGDLGPVRRTSSFPVTVAEIQALNR